MVADSLASLDSRLRGNDNLLVAESDPRQK